MNTPGITLVKPLQVFGYLEAPFGHFRVKLENVRVPLSNLLVAEGKGFEIAQVGSMEGWDGMEGRERRGGRALFLFYLILFSFVSFIICSAFLILSSER
jgi:hypothetical protein